MDCPKGGFPSKHHNLIRDITANLMTEVCNEVAVEPLLQPLSGEKFSYVSAITDNHARSASACKVFTIHTFRERSIVVKRHHFKLYGVMRFHLECGFALNDIMNFHWSVCFTFSVYRSSAKNGNEPIICYIVTWRDSNKDL